jgi:hypothetical protein
MMLLDVERERLEVRRRDHDDVVFPIRPSDGKYVCVEPVERFADACLAKEVENDGPDKVRGAGRRDHRYRLSLGGERQTGGCVTPGGS